eukprot:XP_025010460.1 basic proline-rich protein-like [Gallus gallus]
MEPAERRQRLQRSNRRCICRAGATRAPFAPSRRYDAGSGPPSGTAPRGWEAPGTPHSGGAPVPGPGTAPLPPFPPGPPRYRPPPAGVRYRSPPPFHRTGTAVRRRARGSARARPRPYRRRTPTATPAGRAAPHLPPRSAPRRGAPPAPSRPAPAPPPPNRSPPPAEAAPLSRPAGSERRPGPPPAGGAEPSGGPESPLAAGGRGPGRAGLGSRRGRARSGAEWPRVVPNEGRAVQPRWAASALCRPGGAVPQQQVAEEPHGPARRLGSAAQGAGIVTKAPLPAAPQRRGDGGTEAKRGTRPTRPGGRHKAQRTAPRSVGNGSARPRRSRARFAGLRCDLCAAPRRAALPGLVPAQRPAVTRRAAPQVDRAP